jgi:predicted transposase/invertase (TIGR01784 family)
MDTAILTADERLLYVTGDEDARRAYLTRFRAMCDLTSMQNASHRKGKEEGLEEGIEMGLAQGREDGLEQGREEEKLLIAKNLLAEGLTPEFVQKTTGLSLDEINRLA